MKTNEQRNKQAVSSLCETTATYKKVKTRYSHCMIHHIVSFLKQEKGLIAEIGPGNGHFAYECIDKGYDYIGFEPAPDLRDALAKEKIKVVDAYVPPIPLENETCDVVYASMILEHYATFNEASYFSAEVHRVLKDNGLVCIIVPNYLTCKGFFLKWIIPIVLLQQNEGYRIY